MYLQIIIVLALMAVKSKNVDGAHFTMTNIQINIPGNRSAYPPENYSIVTLLAMSDDKGTNSKHFTYSLENNKRKYLQIFRSTGDIMFTKNYFNADIKDIQNISVIASVQDSSGKKDNTTFQVNISSVDSIDCHRILPDLCYWQSAYYRIYENRKPSIIGTLSSPYLAKLCPDYKIHYNVTKGNGRFGVIPPITTNDSWYLQTLIPLERDTKHLQRSFKLKSNEFVKLSVMCIAENANGSKIQLAKNLSLHVLDENDNAPFSQEDGDIFVFLDKLHVEKGKLVELKHKDSNKNLLIIDWDSPSVNNHEIKIINDSLKLFEVNCATHSVTPNHETCDLSTVVNCKLHFARDMEIPDLPYTIILQINDTTLLPGFGESAIQIPIHFHAAKSADSPHAMGRTMPPEKLRKLNLYPDRDVYIFRSAGPYARITQPKDINISKNYNNFTLKIDEKFNGSFRITPTEGILYTYDIDIIRQSSSSIRVFIHWEEKGKDNFDEIIVNLVEEPNKKCSNRSNQVNDWNHCSKYRNVDECYGSCAIGTGGSVSYNNVKNGDSKRCMWHGDQKASKVTTKLYSTCTPDIKTCPDGICDSLEALYHLICPQDCTNKTTIPITRNRKTGLGIGAAEGVCVCDETGSCVCGLKPKKTKNNKVMSNESTSGNINDNSTTTTTPNISRQIGPEIASCGTSCVLGILAGGLFLLGAVAAVVVCWRLGRVHKVRGKFSDDNNDLSAPLSDYVDRGIIPENTITLNFDMTTSLNQHNNKIPPDPKWEFPRNHLIIEQTLGEGEFGRVLRARAKDIAGQPGYTIVAVKTLKEDAREAELADLLSEYQLLKEVSHPNIIRLLGASTIPGGPVYLIIEFAQYGSLRSYLRRSRHLKSESQPPFSARLEENQNTRNDNYDEPKHCKVTPTDILSFAWQISNGMSYLSDVKLVHRDLAARNVLLSERKVCKISDFGLTRDIYEDDAYFKRSKGRVPVKWMAPESLSDHVYTSKSDVWSFGILVWELVTLGATPYPGIQVQNLFNLLKSGYRMERPENCSPALFKVMRSCWHIDPEQRPTFHELSAKWEKMLTDQVEYLDLTPNAIHNRSYFCTLDDSEDITENENNVDLNEDEKNLEENLAKNQEYPKCADSEKLLGDQKATNNNSDQLSPLIDQSTQGYETPVKIRYKTERSTTPTNENPQYYTNMDARRTNSK